jgi:hypothetical protein
VVAVGRPRELKLGQRGGELRTDSESTLAVWVRPEDLDGYDIHPAILRRISHALHGTGPHVD